MVESQKTIPILRIFDRAKVKDFYVGYVGFLGFAVDWEHHFEENTPAYIQVSRAGLTLHLSEHHGDACLPEAESGRPGPVRRVARTNRRFGGGGGIRGAKGRMGAVGRSVRNRESAAVLTGCMSSDMSHTPHQTHGGDPAQAQGAARALGHAARQSTEP